MDHNNDRALREAGDTVIRLPLHLTTGQIGGNDEALAAKTGQHGIPAQRAPLKAPRGTSKNLQIFHGSQLFVSTGPSNRRLIEGICKALEALLRATTCEKANYDSGSRSLFSICLRRTPTYIAEEQRLTNDEDPENDIDVSSEVYSGLEALGSAPDGGWESLREVVRAHGINLVGEAIREGLIGLPLSRHILSLCLKLAAYDEAECVIESMIALVKSRTLPPKESRGLCAGPSYPVQKWAASHRLHATPLTEETSLVAGALKYYVSQTGRHGFMYRQTAVMLGNGILPVEWMSSKAMIDCWNGVIRSITQEDDHAQSAALLLRIAISKSYRWEGSNSEVNPQIHDLRLRACEPATVRPNLRSYKSGPAVETFVDSQPSRLGEGGQLDDIDNALQSTFSNILTVLSAINILRSSKPARDSSHPDLLSVAILRNMALEIRQLLEVAHVTSSVSRSWTLPAESLSLPLLAAGLGWIASRKAGTELSPDEVLDLVTLANLPSSKVSLDNAGSFLGQVARCCDQAESDDGFRFVQIMVQDLVSIATSNIYDKPTRRFCTGIAHAAAFAFSEDTGQPKHLDWALDVESEITRTLNDSPKTVVDKTPARAVMRSKGGYKWEEGICEWIAKTPALALQRPTAIEDVDRDSTYREVPKLMLVQASSLPSGISPFATDRLPRPKRRPGGEGKSCDFREIGKAKGSCGKFRSSEKLLFIRVSPRPQKVPSPQTLSQVNAADDFDELSTPASSREKPIALREIPNLPSGVKRKSFGGKYNNHIIGSCNVDIPLKKKCRPDTETFTQYTDDELGFP